MASPPPAGDRTELLLKAWTLRKAGDATGLRNFLEPLPGEVLVAEPELGVRLIAAHVYTHQTEAAASIQALLAPTMALRANDRILREFMNFQGILLLRAGALGRAQAVLRDVEALAAEAGDEVTRVDALVNWAVIADIRCEYEESLLAYQRARAAAQLGGVARQISLIHHHIGMTFRQLGYYAEAERHFERAQRETFYRVDHALHDMERAILFHLTDKPDVARELADRAHAAMRALGSPSGLADTLRVKAMIAAKRGSLDEALHHLAAARDLAPQGDPLTRAEVFEEIAVVRRMRGEAIESAEAEALAASIYTEMEAPRRAERMRLRLAVLELDGAP